MRSRRLLISSRRLLISSRRALKSCLRYFSQGFYFFPLVTLSIQDETGQRYADAYDCN